MINPKDTYKHQLKERIKIRQKIKKRLTLLAMARALAFVLAFVSGIVLFPEFIYAGIFAIIFFVLVFIYFVQIHTRENEKLEKSELLISIYNNELSYLKSDFSAFEDGSEYIETDHNFTIDLDVFGKESLFHRLNRTVTSFGKQVLSYRLKKQLTEISYITLVQEAVSELSVDMNFRHSFQVLGKFYRGEESNLNYNKLKGVESYFLHKKLLRFFSFIIPAICFIALILYFIDILSVSNLILVYVIPSLFTVFNLRKINELHGYLSGFMKTIRQNQKLIEFLCEKKFNSKILNQLQDELKTNEKIHPLKKLSKLLEKFDARSNLLVNVLFNLFILRDIHLSFMLEKWLKNYSEKLEKWLELVAEFDSLISLANFKFNHPEAKMPCLVNQNLFFETKNMKHPFIDYESSIGNSFSISQKPDITIVTGANMAGKSTFLRTIGLNSIMAMVGLPVFADSFSISPVPVFTSMRTEDSIQKSESYFFAELKRLKLLIQTLEKEPYCLILLDEILRGTNSKDKHKGSEGLLRQLLDRNACGIIATHDISLGELAEEFPEYVRNKRFEVEIENDELVFDYKLKDGISQNLNATFLMKKMGVI